MSHSGYTVYTEFLFFWPFKQLVTSWVIWTPATACMFSAGQYNRAGAQAWALHCSSQSTTSWDPYVSPVVLWHLLLWKLFRQALFSGCWFNRATAAQVPYALHVAYRKCHCLPCHQSVGQMNCQTLCRLYNMANSESYCTSSSVQCLQI